MSESEAEDFEYLSNLSINIELDSFEALSTVSSAPSQVCEFGRSLVYSPQNAHIVHQLAQRQIGLSSRKFFKCEAPLRSYYLHRVLPATGLQNQIFMGMSRCGCFLMTYSSQLLQEEDEWCGCVYRYQLHWWMFPPEGTARQIASVALFGSSILTSPLQIYICQWPKFNDKVLVYGLMKESGGTDGDGAPVNQRAFVTVTATPAKHCTKCDLLQQTTSLLGGKNTRCLEHAFTAHTSFDIASPYPEFQPKIHLKFDDLVVFNTNNALHALRISFDKVNSVMNDEVETDGVLSVQVPLSPNPPCQVQSILQEQIIRDFADEGSLTPRHYDELSPSPVKPDMSYLTEPASSLSCMSPPLPTRLKTFPECLKACPSTETAHEFLAPKGVFKVKKLGARRLGFRQFFSRQKSPMAGVFRDSHSRKTSPYEFVDDSQSEVEQLSQFRRKRLADKTYEFQESDAENILPFSMARHESARNVSRFHVLRPLNRNTREQSRMLRNRYKQADLKTAGVEVEVVKKRVCEEDVLVDNLSGRYESVSYEEEERLHAGLRRLRHCFRGTAARFTRRFVETEEFHAAPDIDDDAGGYHTVLHVEAVGSDGAPLRDVVLTAAGTGAGTTPQDLVCVLVEQQSLDIEAICQSVATSLCIVAHKTFSFCNDYDIEVVDVCPRSGDVLVLLMMRIEGCEGKKEEGSKIEEFEASVTLLWNLVQGDYRIIMVVPPQKMASPWNSACVWNPAREASRAIRLSLPHDVTTSQPAVRLCSNASLLRGASLEQIQDYDNGIQFLL